MACRCCPGVLHLGQYGEQGGTFHQGYGRRAVVGPPEEIALWVPRPPPLGYVRWPVMNAHAIRDPSPSLGACPGTALGVTEAEPANHLRLQRATGQDVGRGVGGFVRNPSFGRMEGTAACVSAIAPVSCPLEESTEPGPQGGARPQAAGDARSERPCLGTTATRYWWAPPDGDGTGAHPAVTMELVRKGRGRTIHVLCKVDRSEVHPDPVWIIVHSSRFNSVQIFTTLHYLPEILHLVFERAHPQLR